MSKTKEVALPGKWRRAVAEASKAELDPNAKLILHTMSTFLTKEGQVSISIKRLVDYTGKAKRSVLRGIADAVEAGYLERTLRGHYVNEEIRQASRYQVRIPISQGAKNDTFASMSPKSPAAEPSGAKGDKVPKTSPKVPNSEAKVPPEHTQGATRAPLKEPKEATEGSFLRENGSLRDPDRASAWSVSSEARPSAEKRGNSETPPQPLSPEAQQQKEIEFGEWIKWCAEWRSRCEAYAARGQCVLCSNAAAGQKVDGMRFCDSCFALFRECRGERPGSVEAAWIAQAKMNRKEAA